MNQQETWESIQDAADLLIGYPIHLYDRFAPPVAQCTHRVGQGRCAAPATVHLIGPDGKPVPGYVVCLRHALQCVAEYAIKLNESWGFVPCDDYGSPLPHQEPTR